jgi:hypothetical protein
MVVTLVKNDPDSQWFHSYPDRQSHIRNPIKILMTDKQRGTHYVDELAGEFWSLGDHNKDRRRILLWKVPPDNPFYDPKKPAILKVPFLLFGDESVEDTDAVLLPILHEIMTDAARKTR